MTRLSVASAVLICCASAPALAQTVTAEPGDTLSSIAARELGAADRWRELCELNSDDLKGNCNLLRIGTVLELPEHQLVQEAQSAAMPIRAARLPPEGIATVPNGKTYTDQPVITARVSSEEGTRRLRFALETHEADSLQVDWAIRSEAGPLEVGILLFASSSVVGRVGINDASGKIETTSTGIVGAVSAMRDSEGWTRVQFEFSLALDQYPLQVLFYPTGIITSALPEEKIYEVTDPVFSARTP